MDISIFQWNACGIKGHFSYFYNYIASLENSPDIICIQESFLKPAHSFSLKGYATIRKDRTFSDKGGVMTLVKHSISYSTLVCPGDVEATGIQIDSSKGLLNIFNVYNPGICIDVEAYKSFFIKNSIVCGDFNAYNPLWGSDRTDTRGKILEGIITESNHVILNNGQGTHIVNVNKVTPLDLTSVCSNLAINANWEVLDDELGSDHFPISISINSRSVKEIPVEENWNIGKINWARFRPLIESSFQQIDLSTDVDTIFEGIIRAITSCVEQSIPQSKGKKRTKNKVSYWNAECENVYKAKTSSKRRAFKSKLLQDFILYKKNKAVCQRVIRSRQRQYFRDYCSTLNRTSNLSKVWKMVKRMSGNSCFKPIPSLKDNNSESYTTHTDKANALGKQFASVSSSNNFSSDFILTKHDFETNHKAKLAYKFPNNKVLNGKMTFKEIAKAISNSRNSAPGEDKIPYNIYKNLPQCCTHVLLNLFNRIWKEGNLPKAWKHSIVSPILKPGKDPHSPASYRPIALTSTLCKIMERIIVNRMSWYCEKYNLFNKFQAGFRKNRSTIDHVLNLHHDINNSMCNKGKALSVFLDIEKAYDMVWKEGLLFKLDSIGIDGQMFNWIKSFLSDRSIQVKVGGVLSDIFLLENGTPQGSVISPILFIIMINDVSCFSNNSIRYTIYADDIAIWKCGRNMKFLSKCIQKALNEISAWCNKWGFKVSTIKSVVLPFSRSPENVNLELNNELLNSVTHFKFLGVVFDSKLCWNKHIEYIHQKCLKRINILKCVSGTSWGANKQTLVILYKSLIRSVLEYGSVVYDSASPSLLKKLDIVQNRCLRISCGAVSFTKTSCLEVECGIEPLSLHRNGLQMKYVARSICYDLSVDYFNKDWKYYYGKYLKNNTHLLDKISPFFSDFDLFQVSRFKWSPIPPWEFPYIDINTSLADIGNKLENSNTLLCLAREILSHFEDYTQVFTDGSKIEKFSSAAFYVKNLQIRKSFKLNSISIYKAELFAILQALIWLESSNIQQTLIVSDSLSSLVSIKEQFSKASPALILKILLSLHRLISSGKDVKMLWVPSHIGIAGNECADMLAKEALNQPSVINIQFELRDIYGLINEFILNRWQCSWSNTPNHFYKMICPKVSFKVKFHDPNRRKEVQISRLRFDCTTLKGHLFKIGSHPTGDCDLCSDFEDPRHILFDCVYYQKQQQELVAHMFNNNIPTVYSFLIANPVMYKYIWEFITNCKITV
ncbi:MAG: reverse transcriptase domain-containing protein [Candidatus Scalindua sp.]